MTALSYMKRRNINPHQANTEQNLCRWRIGNVRNVLCLGVFVVYCIGSSQWINLIPTSRKTVDVRLLGILPSYETHGNIRHLLSPHESVRNSNRVKIWREDVNEMCEKASTEEDVLATKELASSGAFVMKDQDEIPLTEQVDEESNLSKEVIHCPFVFLDLGSGVGDTIGEFIDTGLVGCPVEEDSGLIGFDAPHFDIDTGKLQYRTMNDNTGLYSNIRKGEENDEFVGWAKERMNRFYGSIGPEDYCVYGVEASPVLGPDLRKLERHILHLDPKPLRHVHFFTETLMLDSDGKTKKFFLDTTNVAERFPGSSVFSSHAKIVESVKHDIEHMDAMLPTMTLSNLMKSTLSYFVDTNNEANEEGEDPNLNRMEKNSRGHLLLHVDIEGSEFHVLNEAKDSGVLCEFALAGNQVDIYIEYHTPDELGRESINAKRWQNDVRPYFRKKCGDNISFYERQRYFMPPAPPKVLTNAVV